MPKSLKFGRYDYAGFTCFASYACCSVVIPVALSYLAKSLHFPLQEGGMGLGGFLQIGRSGPMVISMLLCGFAAARFGKCRTLGFSVLLMSLGIILAAVSPFYGILFLALLLAGFGEGVIEGLATPVIQDLHPRESGRYINFSHAFWSIGVLGTSIIAGALLYYGVNWRIVVAGAGLFGIVPAILYLMPGDDPCRQEERKEHHQVFHDAVRILRMRHFWLFFAAMFVAGGGEFGITFWIPTFVLDVCGGTIFDAGVSAAFFSAGMVTGRMGFAYLIRQNRLKELLVYTALGATILCVVFPFVSHLWILFFLLYLIGITAGPFWPSIQSYATTRLTVDDTMLLILLSCAGVPGCGFFTMLMGVMGDHLGLRLTFLLIVPGCFLLIAFLVGLDWFFAKRKSFARLKRIKL